MGFVKPTKIDDIGDFFNCLFVFEKDGKYYWGFDADGIEGEQEDRYKEIDKELYEALIAYEARRSKS